MFKLLFKKYKAATLIVLLLSFILSTAVLNMNTDYISLYQVDFDSYITSIIEQSENIDDVSIFQDHSSYDIKKIKKTGEIYSVIENSIISENKTDKEENMLSDIFIYGFIMIALLYELYLFVYDRDKGYDSLIMTLPLGKRKYYFLKLLYILTTISLIFIINSIYMLIYSSITGIDLNQSIQSVSGYLHSWYNGNVISYYLVITLYRFIVINFIMIIMSVLYIHDNQIYKSLIKLIIIILISIIIHLYKPIKMLGPVFSISSGYLKELYLSRIIIYPLYTINISLFILLVLSIISLLIIYHYTIKINNDYIIVKKNKNKRSSFHNNFYFESKKLLIINSYIILSIIVLLFQCGHYYTKNVYEIRDDAYYRQYMEYLEGEYTLDKEQYLINEGIRYNEIKERINELILKGNRTASEVNELQTLQYNLRGEYAYGLVVERMNHLKQYKDASFTNDLSFIYMIQYSNTDNMLDFILYGIIVILCAVLLYYEEHICDMDSFLITLSGYDKVIKSKQLLLLFVSLFFSVVSVVSKIVYYSYCYGMMNYSYKAYSLPYLYQIGLPMWIYVIIIIIIIFIIYYTVSLMLFRYLLKINNKK